MSVNAVCRQGGEKRAISLHTHFPPAKTRMADGSDGTAGLPVGERSGVERGS